MKNRFFKIILNGCDVHPRATTMDIRKTFNIPNNHFVFLFVGNICIRKNQSQVVRAFSQLDITKRETIHVIFVGGGDTDRIKRQIQSEGLQSNLHVCGIVPKADIHNYYAAADATILTSKSEGFGLSIIEGYAYGLPCLTFSDLAAVKDLYNVQTMLLVDSRKDKDLGEGLLSMTNIKWDKSVIIEFAQLFSLSEMSHKYISFYNEIISLFHRK